MTQLPPPEALLIERARTELRPTLSIRKAAAQADLSEGRWRQIAKGYQTATPTVKIPVRAPAETLARMAHVVKVSAHQLTEVGRKDAALELTLLQQNMQDWHGQDLSDISDQQLMDELSRRLSSRADNTSNFPEKKVPPLQLVARKVSPGDSSTFQQE